VILFVLAASRVAAANDLVDLVDLEIKLESRAREIVKRVDPEAEVYVKITPQKVSQKLPGMLIDTENMFFDLETAEGNQRTSSKVRVQIVSKLATFPEWSTKLIQEKLSIGAGVEIAIQNLDMAAPGAGSATRGMASVEEGSGDRPLSLFYLLAAFFAVSVAAFVWGIKALIKGIVARSAQSSSGQPLVPPSQSRGNLAAREATSHPPSFSQHGGITKEEIELRDDQILALFGDCYWSQQDEYAAWLWQSLRAEQRNKLFKSWKQGHGYLMSLQHVPPVFKNFHLSAQLNNVVPTHLVASADLKKILMKNPSWIPFVGELRTKELFASLEDQVLMLKSRHSGFDESKRASFIEVLAATSSVNLDRGRALADSREKIVLSSSDEESVFKNPNRIPVELRHKFRGLVWLALTPGEVVARVLQLYSAQELAEVWVGSQLVLAKLAESIPEAKMQIVDAYRKNVTASYQSELYMEICERGFAEYLDIQPKESRKIAA